MATFKFHCPHCKQPIEADEEWKNKTAQCPCCNREMTITDNIELSKISGNQASSTNQTAKTQGAKMKEYKVLTQKDKWFSAKFDPEMLEKAINSYAQQGWIVVSAATATFPGFIGGNREEMVVIFERDK